MDPIRALIDASLIGYLSTRPHDGERLRDVVVGGQVKLLHAPHVDLRTVIAGVEAAAGVAETLGVIASYAVEVPILGGVIADARFGVASAPSVVVPEVLLIRTAGSCGAVLVAAGSRVRAQAESEGVTAMSPAEFCALIAE